MRILNLLIRLPRKLMILGLLILTCQLGTARSEGEGAAKKALKATTRAAAEREAKESATALRERISELEAQNAAIIEELAELRRLVKAGTPIAAPAETGPPAVVAPKPEAAQSEPDQPKAIQTEGNASALSFYGFVRLDAIVDDSRPDSIQTPTFIQSESAAGENNADFSFHPRLTRIGMNYRGPVIDELGGARISGKIETDFQNGGRESRAIARYRHAYLKLDWENSSLLLGQTWDIISPLYPTVNADTLMWNAGNLGDRRMQARYTYQPDNGFSVRAGLGLTGAVSPQDLDGDGFRDGEDATLPNFQGRVGYSSPEGGFSLGVWGHYALEQTTLPFAGENEFDSYSAGLDYDFRFNPVVSLKGELWAGSNLGDFRGGIGQGVNAATGREIASRGGWIELGLKAASGYSFSAGFTTNDVKNRDVLPGGRTENRAWYITNQFRIAAPFMLGIDYLHWRTKFLGSPKGTDNRLNLYILYNF